jgi:hypothetical protein
LDLWVRKAVPVMPVPQDRPGPLVPRVQTELPELQEQQGLRVPPELRELTEQQEPLELRELTEPQEPLEQQEPLELQEQPE